MHQNCSSGEPSKTLQGSEVTVTWKLCEFVQKCVLKAAQRHQPVHEDGNPCLLSSAKHLGKSMSSSFLLRCCTRSIGAYSSASNVTFKVFGRSTSTFRSDFSTDILMSFCLQPLVRFVVRIVDLNVRQSDSSCCNDPIFQSLRT